MYICVAVKKRKLIDSIHSLYITNYNRDHTSYAGIGFLITGQVTSVDFEECNNLDMMLLAFFNTSSTDSLFTKVQLHTNIYVLLCLRQPCVCVITVF